MFEKAVYTEDKIAQAEDWIRLLVEMPLEEYLEQFEQKDNLTMLKQRFLWFTASKDMELQAKWKAFLKVKSQFLYHRKIAKALKAMQEKSEASSGALDIRCVRSRSYKDDGIRYKAVLVWLEYFDDATKKEKYQSSILVEDKMKPGIVEAILKKYKKSDVFNKKL